MQRDELVVRPATLDDLEQLTDLSIAVQELHFQGRPDLFSEPDRATLRDFLVSQIAGSALIWLAEMGASAVGYVLAELVERGPNPFRHASVSLYIHHIAVAQDAQRSGVGSRLIATAVDFAQRQNASAVRLDSWSFNTDAHTFFEHEGFLPMNIVFERKLSSSS